MVSTAISVCLNRFWLSDRFGRQSFAESELWRKCLPKDCNSCIAGKLSRFFCIPLPSHTGLQINFQRKIIDEMPPSSLRYTTRFHLLVLFIAQPPDVLKKFSFGFWTDGLFSQPIAIGAVWCSQKRSQVDYITTAAHTSDVSCVQLNHARGRNC